MVGRIILLNQEKSLKPLFFIRKGYKISSKKKNQKVTETWQMTPKTTDSIFFGYDFFE